MADERRLVYSTDGSLPLPTPRKKAAVQVPGANVPPSDGVVRAGCERRRGGAVTRVYGVPEREVADFAKTLKQRCGTGGTVREGVIELQGDRRDAALAYAAQLGWRVKRMGG